jgi:hypothetical protein
VKKKTKTAKHTDITAMLAPKVCVLLLLYSNLSLGHPTTPTQTCTQNYILYHPKRWSEGSPKHIRKIRYKRIIMKEKEK